MQLLKNKIEKNVLEEELFYFPYDNGKYIFGLIPSKPEIGIDIFAIKAIYDSILDLDDKIKFSFYQASNYPLSDNPFNHKPFTNPSREEKETIDYIENIIFRTTMLWDMLAQLCNLHWKTHKKIDEIHYKSFFNNNSQGKKSKRIAREIMEYLKEEDYINGDLEPWEGNHNYIKDFRDQLTHRNSPNISTLSSLDISMRPPVVYLLKRVIEDYLKAIYFINIIVSEIIKNLESEASDM